MKFLIVSDIHGSANSAKMLVEKFEKTGADRIILLGDLLYYGPRNGLPENFNPQEVTNILNSLADKILAVRGNCDSEIDQVVLDFQLAENMYIVVGDKIYFCTHGHHISHETPANFADGITVLYGHFHVTRKTEISGVTYFNIGSITKPKHDSKKCYGILDENGIKVFDLDDNLILE